MNSTTGLVIQFTGIFLVTVLSLFLRRSLKTASATLWAAAWSSLSIALFFLSLAFSYERYGKIFFSLYFFGEYVFGLLLIAGCHNFSVRQISGRRIRLLLIPFALIAAGLPWLANDFNLIFNLHALLLATLFAVASWAFSRSKVDCFGGRVVQIALSLLALDFLHYFVVFTVLKYNSALSLPPAYLAFNPIIDLVLEILLGFGMVIVLLEQILLEVREVNRKLETAQEKLELLANIDPLTTAFNRHAFYGYLRKQGGDGSKISGCVGFFDIDDLKPINDCHGHAVGDMAIRAVVGAIRDLMRAEDLLYRWGGDEFFVIMVTMNAETARARMNRLEEMLSSVRVQGCDELLAVHVSYGFTDFAEISDLEQAIQSADEEMYRRKQAHKLARRNNPPVQPGLIIQPPTESVLGMPG